MFLIVTRDAMFFTAMKNIINKKNIIHIQNEKDINLTLHQNASIIIDTLMNNIFHLEIFSKLKKLNPVNTIVFSPFAIKPCLGKASVTFVKRTISIVDFLAILNGCSCSTHGSEISISYKQHQVLTCIANQMNTNDILGKLKISLKTYYCHKHHIMMILNIRRITELVRHQHIKYLVG